MIRSAVISEYSLLRRLLFIKKPFKVIRNNFLEQLVNVCERVNRVIIFPIFFIVVSVQQIGFSLLPVVGDDILCQVATESDCENLLKFVPTGWFWTSSVLILSLPRAFPFFIWKTVYRTSLISTEKACNLVASF